MHKTRSQRLPVKRPRGSVLLCRAYGKRKLRLDYERVLNGPKEWGPLLELRLKIEHVAGLVRELRLAGLVQYLGSVEEPKHSGAEKVAPLLKG